MVATGVVDPTGGDGLRHRTQHPLRGAPLLLAVLLLLVMAALPALADPQLPALTGRIVDQAGMLGASDEAAIHKKLADLEEKTTDQLVVVTLDSLQGYAIEEFGVALGRAWQIGQQGKNNGVLLIVAPKERKVRIEVGYGLEGVLTDTLAGSIVHNRILPLFRQGQMAEGIIAGVNDIVDTLTGDVEAVKARAEPREGEGGGIDVLSLLIFGFWGLMFFGGLSQHMLSAGSSRQGGVVIVPYAPPPPSGSWSGGSHGGGWSSGGGGGGFSGGGGSFGGGGASGGW
jgi:uncharacterized protein